MANQSLVDRVREALPVSRREMKKLAGKRYSEGYAEGYNDHGEDEPVSGTMRLRGYRSSNTSERDFNLASYLEVLKVAWDYWQSSPVTKRVMTIKRDYIMGSGIEPRSDNDDVDTVVKDFWSRNKMEVERAKEFCLQLFLLGSQIFPVFVKEADGAVSLGYIDPEAIEMIITHPDNAMEQYAIIIKASTPINGWEKATNKRAYRIIREDQPIVVEEGDKQVVRAAQHEGLLVTADQATLEPWEEKMLTAFGLSKYSGSCFYTKVNSVSNHPYGYSDLQQNLDWIDQLDAILFALADRERMADYFSFDVAIKGDKDAVESRSKELRANPPKKGSVNVHTTDETWTLHSPNLHQTGSVETYNAILTFILGGMGYPRHWYGYGDDTNRATAQAQGDPTWRSLENDQGIVQNMFLRMCQFAVDQAKIAGTLSVGEDDPTAEIVLDMPEMTTNDITSISGVIGNVVLALVTIYDKGWITQDTVLGALGRIFEEMGIEFDPAAEKDQLESPEEQELSVVQANQTNLIERLYKARERLDKGLDIRSKVRGAGIDLNVKRDKKD